MERNFRCVGTILRYSLIIMVPHRYFSTNNLSNVW